MTLIICFGGLIIVFWLVCPFNRLIQPEIENVEKQKQFVRTQTMSSKRLAVIGNTEIERNDERGK